MKKPAKVGVKPASEAVKKPVTPLKTSMKKKPVSDRKQTRVKGEKQMQEKLKFWLALSDSKPVVKVKPDDQAEVGKIVTVKCNDRKLDRKTVLAVPSDRKLDRKKLAAAETSIYGDSDRKVENPVNPDSNDPPANGDLDDSLNLTVDKPELDSRSYQLKKPGTNVFVDGQVEEVAGGPGGQPVRCDGVCDEEALQQESYEVFDVLTLPTTPPDATTLADLQVRHTKPNNNLYC